MRWTCTSKNTTPKRVIVKELVKSLEDGPASLEDHGAKEDYDLWVKAWIIPELKGLFPKYFRDEKKSI